MFSHDTAHVLSVLFLVLCFKDSISGTVTVIFFSIQDHLDSKRVVFPRFYFLSNDELLEILGQSNDPNAVQV